MGGFGVFYVSSATSGSGCFFMDSFPLAVRALNPSGLDRYLAQASHGLLVAAQHQNMCVSWRYKE